MSLPAPLTDVDWAGNPTATYHDTLFYDDSCQSYWRMASAASLVDEKGLNNGTFADAPTLISALLPYESDQALSFDGTDDYAIVPSSSSLLQAASWTYEGLVKFTALPGAQKALLSKGAIRLDILASGKLQAQVSNDQSGTLTVTTIQSTTVLQAGSAYMVAFGWDATAQLFKLYVNGRLEASASHTVGTELTSAPLTFAGRLNGTAPTLRSSTSYSGPDSSTHTNVIGNLPAGTASGDLLVAHVALRASSTVTPPTGWTKLATGNYDAASNWVWEIWTRRADGTEGATFTWTVGTATTYSVGISAWIGVNTTYPFANPVYSFNDNTHPISTRSHLPAADNTVVLALLSAPVGGASGNFVWTGGTEIYDGGSSSFPGPGATAAYTTVAAAAPTSLSVDKTSPGTSIAGAAVFLVLNGTGGNSFAGVEMDEWVLLNKALTDNDALDHYTARLSGYSGWTDVTADNRGFTSKRGRQYELDKIEAAEYDQTFHDPNRDYDPSNTSGAHYPNVITKRRIRTRAQVGANTYPVFQGFVERWPADYITPEYQEVKVTASDGLAQLALAPVSGTITRDLSGAQIHKLLDQAKWPRSDRAIDTGQFIMDNWTLDAGAFALPSIQDIADSELGIFFVSASGIATFHDYQHRWSVARSLTPQAKFSDVAADIAGGAVPYLWGGIQPSYDDDHTINTWTVATASGETATASDVVGARRTGPMGQTRSTRLDGVGDALTQAKALLQETARPGQRFDSLTVMPDNDTAWQTVLNLEISDRVTVVRTPAVGSQIVQDCFVEGIQIDALPSRWQVTFELSPVNPLDYYTMILLDGPAAYYRLDSVS